MFKKHEEREKEQEKHVKEHIQNQVKVSFLKVKSQIRTFFSSRSMLKFFYKTKTGCAKACCRGFYAQSGKEET